MKTIASRRHNALRTSLIVLVLVGLVYSAVSLVSIHCLYTDNFPRYDRPKYSGYLQFTDLPESTYATIHFPSGKNNLAGYIFGQENNKGLVVISPGRGQGGEHYLAETQYFVAQGWRVFSFDYTGCFASEGENMVGLQQARIDLDAALAYIQSDPSLNELPMVLWGHSWGAYAVTAVLKDHPNVSAAVSISGFNSPLGLIDEYVRSEVGGLGFALYPFEWVYQTVRFRQSARLTAVDGINSGSTPVMIVHDAADEAIAYDGASIIAQRQQITNPNAVYITRNTVDGSGHMDLLRSQAAIQYKNQKNQEFKPIYDQFQGAVPDSELAEFHAGVDHQKTSELDVDFLQQINQFFEDSLKNG
jgi:pimeloyl-ACP methyl ester carboxylesterase